MEQQSTANSEAAEHDPIEVRIGLGHTGDQMFNIRISPNMEESLQEALDDAGISTSKILEFSAGSDLAIVAASFIHTGGLVGLAHALQVWLRRHRDKSMKLTINNSPVEMKGLSEKAMVNVLQELRREQYELDWQWHAQDHDPMSEGARVQKLISALRLAAESTGNPERSVVMWVVTPGDRNPIILLKKAGYDEVSGWLDELQQSPSGAGIYAAARSRLVL